MKINNLFSFSAKPKNKLIKKDVKKEWEKIKKE